jgi:hypothetical protein
MRLPRLPISSLDRSPSTKRLRLRKCLYRQRPPFGYCLLLFPDFSLVDCSETCSLPYSNNPHNNELHGGTTSASTYTYCSIVCVSRRRFIMVARQTCEHLLIFRRENSCLKPIHMRTVNRRFRHRVNRRLSASAAHVGSAGATITTILLREQRRAKTWQ